MPVGVRAVSLNHDMCGGIVGKGNVMAKRASEETLQLKISPGLKKQIRRKALDRDQTLRTFVLSALQRSGVNVSREGSLVIAESQDRSDGGAGPQRLRPSSIFSAALAACLMVSGNWDFASPQASTSTRNVCSRSRQTMMRPSSGGA